jgi:putative protein-disulfide isomerase
MRTECDDATALNQYTSSPAGPTLFYFHDPMCSWCWAFRPVLAELERQLPSGWLLVRILGGLAPDTDQPMPAAQQQTLRGIWQTIQREVPGTTFNYAFWETCQPRRSTYPACRAVIAARRQGHYEVPMIEAIQRAYYLAARNPSDDRTLIALAEALGLDTARFTQDLNAPDTQAEFEQEIRFTRDCGVTGFPSLVLYAQGRWQPLPHDYHDPSLLLRRLQQIPRP